MGSGIARHARAQVRVWRAGRGLGVDEGHLNGRGRDRGGWGGVGWAGTSGSHGEAIARPESVSFGQSHRTCRARGMHTLAVVPHSTIASLSATCDRTTQCMQQEGWERLAGS